MLFKQAWKTPIHDEIYITSNNGKELPMLMSANTFKLDGAFAISIILTDNTIQNKNLTELKGKA